MDSLLLFTIASFAIILVLLLSRISQIRKANKSCSNLPPGSSGWPLIGETLKYTSCFEKFIRDRMTKFSPDVFQTHLAGERVAVFCGPSANKFLFSNESKLVRSWWPRSITGPLHDSHRNISTSTWKLIHDESFRFLRLESLKQYVAVMDTTTMDHLETLWAPFNEVSVHPLAIELTIAVACQMFFKGSNLSPQQVRELAETFKHWTDKILAVPVNIPGTSHRKALKRGKLVVKKILDIVRHRKVTDQQRANNEACPDLLSRLLLLSDEDGRFANEKDIAIRFTGLMFGSFDNASETITSVVRNLIDHTEVYEKVLQVKIERNQEAIEGEEDEAHLERENDKKEKS